MKGSDLAEMVGVFLDREKELYAPDDRPPPEGPLRTVRDAWTPSAFWIEPQRTPCLPIIAISPIIEEYVKSHPHPRIKIYPNIKDGMQDRLACREAQISAAGRHVVAYYSYDGINTEGQWDVCLDMRAFISALDPMPASRWKGALQWVFNPFLCPETTFQYTAAYAWAECEELSAGMKRNRARYVPARLIRRMLRICFQRGRARSPVSLHLLDLILDYNEEKDRRTLTYKQRHKFDLISIIYAAVAAWGGGPHRERLYTTMYATLSMMCAARMNYERMLVTFTYIFSSGYWPMIASLELREESHLLGLQDWIKLHKEYTATIVRTWTWPYTRGQTIAALYLVDSQTAVGWADNAPDGGDSLLSTLLCAAGEPARYVVPGAGEEAYYEAFDRHAKSLLVEQFEAGRSRAVTMDRYCELRAANMSAGAAGGLVRTQFGSTKVPPGCSKAYAASTLTAEEFATQADTLITVVDKPDERGVQRGLAAADLFTVRDEQFCFAPISKGMVWTGADIGENDIQRADRVLRQVAFVVSRATIACFDWEKFDKYMALLEKLGLLKAGRIAAGIFPDGELRQDLQAAFDRVISSHRSATFRSPAYAPDRRGHDVDAAIAAAPNRMRRISPCDIEVTNVEAQQSGRGNTLESNGEIAEIRVRIRDEISGTKPVERDGRGDDLFEAYERWSDAVQATLTFTDMGNKANLRKLTIQEHSGVYFKVVHVGGRRPARRGMPARVALSLVSSKPAIGAAPFPSFSESISGGVSNCYRGIRRGLSIAFCTAMSRDCVSYNCRTVPQVTRVVRSRQKKEDGSKRKKGSARPKLKRVVRTADPLFVEADQLHGGLGILPIGKFKPEIRLKCVQQKGSSEVRADLNAERRKLLSAGEFPGVDDLINATVTTFKEQHHFEPDSAALAAFREGVMTGSKMQDGSGDLSMLLKGEAQLKAYSRVHFDKNTTLVKLPEAPTYRCRMMCLSIAGAVQNQRRDLHPERDPLQKNVALQNALPGIGILASIDRGLAKHVVAAADPSDRLSLAIRLCNSSVEGQAFLSRTGGWPSWLRLHIMMGTHLFPGGWGGLISPDLFGVFKAVCYIGLEDDIWENGHCHRNVFESHCRWTEIIDRIGRYFYALMSDLCLE